VFPGWIRNRADPPCSFHRLSACSNAVVTAPGDVTETARMLRVLLDAIERGEITADKAEERGIVRQLRGALIALELLDRGDKGRDT